MYEKLQKRLKAAKANKLLWESLIRDCYDFAMPQRNTIDKWSPGADKRNRVFDSTAEQALEDYANRMVAQLVPSSTNWMELEAGSQIPKEEIEQVNKQLEEMNEIVFAHLHSSNFASQINESFLDLGISTGAIIVEEGDGIQSGLNFRSISLSELILERSSLGIVETVFREFKIPAKDIKYTYPKAKLTEDLEEIIQRDPTKDISLVEGVVKEDNGKFIMVVMYTKGKSILYEEKLDYNPYVVFRESSIPGEVYGRGRVMRCLNDIKTLNRMVEDYLKGLNWSANPVILAQDDGIINPATTRVGPGDIVTVGSNDNANPTMKGLQLYGQPQLLDFAITKYQDNIKQTMMSKPFGNIEDTPVRTATEMSIRNADLAQTTLAASSRIQTELLERLIASCVNILKKQGKLPDIKVNGKEVALKFVNPASRAQNESELAAYGRFAEMMATMDPSIVAQTIKLETIPANIVDALGLPESIKRDEAETKQMQEAQAQQMAAMQQQQGVQ